MAVAAGALDLDLAGAAAAVAVGGVAVVAVLEREVGGLVTADGLGADAGLATAEVAGLVVAVLVAAVAVGVVAVVAPLARGHLAVAALLRALDLAVLVAAVAVGGVAVVTGLVRELREAVAARGLGALAGDRLADVALLDDALAAAAVAVGLVAVVAELAGLALAVAALGGRRRLDLAQGAAAVAVLLVVVVALLVAFLLAVAADDLGAGRRTARADVAGLGLAGLAAAVAVGVVAVVTGLADLGRAVTAEQGADRALAEGVGQRDEQAVGVERALALVVVDHDRDGVGARLVQRARPGAERQARARVAGAGEAGRDAVDQDVLDLVVGPDLAGEHGAAGGGRRRDVERGRVVGVGLGGRVLGAAVAVDPLRAGGRVDPEAFGAVLGHLGRGLRAAERLRPGPDAVVDARLGRAADTVAAGVDVRRVLAAVARLDLAGLAAAVAVLVVGVVALFADMHDAVAADFLLAGGGAAVTVGGVVVVALLGALDRAVAADRLDALGRAALAEVAGLGLAGLVAAVAVVGVAVVAGLTGLGRAVAAELLADRADAEGVGDRHQQAVRVGGLAGGVEHHDRHGVGALLVERARPLAEAQAGALVARPGEAGGHAVDQHVLDLVVGPDDAVDDGQARRSLGRDVEGRGVVRQRELRRRGAAAVAVDPSRVGRLCLPGARGAVARDLGRHAADVGLVGPGPDQVIAAHGGLAAETVTAGVEIRGVLASVAGLDVAARAAAVARGLVLVVALFARVHHAVAAGTRRERLARQGQRRHRCQQRPAHATNSLATLANRGSARTERIEHATPPMGIRAGPHSSFRQPAPSTPTQSSPARSQISARSYSFCRVMQQTVSQGDTKTRSKVAMHV